VVTSCLLTGRKSQTGKSKKSGRDLPEAISATCHNSWPSSPIFPLRTRLVGVHLWVGGGVSSEDSRESTLLMAQLKLLCALQTTGGHWVTVGFNTPPAGPRTPGTEPDTEPCREDTGLRGSGTLLRGPGCGWGGCGGGGGGCCCCCCCNFFLLIFLSFALRF
jgi:hypothetical protein